MGYVEQKDCLVGHHTVREALDFSAALRLPSTVSAETRAHFVDQIVEDLELTHMQARLIGDANVDGLSPGEMKRLTIGQRAEAEGRGRGMGRAGAGRTKEEGQTGRAGTDSSLSRFLLVTRVPLLVHLCSGIELAANPTFLFLGAHSDTRQMCCSDQLIAACCKRQGHCTTMIFVLTPLCCLLRALSFFFSRR